MEPLNPAPAAAPLLQVENLLKRFPGTVAVRNVSFGIWPGTIHALVGENGAGKSTIIKMLSGVYSPDGGQILIKGQPVDITSPHVAQECGISTVYQERTLINNLSALENIFLGREIQARTGGSFGLTDLRAMRDAVEELCQDFEFDVRLLHQAVEELSALSRQIVEVIKALVFRSELIILDEATSALDGMTERSVFEALYKMGNDRTVVVISHNLESLKRSDTIILLDQGSIVSSGNFDELNRSNEQFRGLVAAKQF